MATYLQSDRPLQIETPLGKDKLLMLGYSGEEGISKCYHFLLNLASDDAGIDAAQLLRKPVTVKLQLADGSTRKIQGLVSRFGPRSQDERLTYYQAEIVPAFWFLSLTWDCRIYQNKNALDIVGDVLGRHSIEYAKHTGSTPPVREYCVQYRETDLDFVSRLLEEEGIFYYFDHSGNKEKLILADSSAKLPDVGSFKVRSQFLQDEDVIVSAAVEQAVHTSKVTLTDYNMETPSTSLLRSVPSTTKGAGEELYDYPGGHDNGGAGSTLARRRMEAQETGETLLRGASNCRAFESGRRFKMAEHFLTSLNQEYVLLSVTERARTGGYAAGNTSTFQYESEFVAVPGSRKFVPAQTHPRPVVRGSQTAVVVGPSGEEIYVDKYGRIKVQFFWDRLGRNNEESSCWVRVASSWAGSAWGAIHIPRIGQEVLIDFLEGDPDHPIVTGSVYNAAQMPPYALPGNMTQSGVKSRSSKQGGSDNFNEIRFEDKKGSEEVHVQAEKDLTTLVKNDETRTVQNDRKTTITNNETREVSKGNDTHTVKKGNQTVTVEEGNQAIEVKKGNHSLKVGQGNHTVDVNQGDQTLKVDQGKQTVEVMGDTKLTVKQGNHTVDVKMGNQQVSVDMGNQSVAVKMGNREVKVNLGSISEEAMQSIELKVGGSSVKVDQMGVTIKGMMVKIEGQIQTQVKGLMTQVNGDAMLTVKGGITMIN